MLHASKLAFALALALTPASAALAHAVATVAVTVTEEGFNPQRVHILQGDTVRFDNAGKSAHWPASNIHPSHGIYPAFDPKQGITPGESWSFRFTKPGTWKMHDHLYPAFVGVVTVTRDADFVEATGSPEVDDAARPSIVSRIGSILLAPFRWMSSLFNRTYYALLPGKVAAALESLDVREMARREDLPAIRTYIRLFGGKKLMGRLLVQSGGGSIEDCHREAHILGRLAYEVQGVQAFRDGDASCHSGFYHGAMEDLLKQEGTDHLADTIKKVCDAFPTGFSRFSCLHGIGHGVLAYAQYDLPEALRSCKSLPTEYDQDSCYGGVFMENIVAGQGNAAVRDHDTQWVNETDPHFPCNGIDKDFAVQYQCYQMQTSWMLTQNGYDFGAVAEECLNAPTDMTAVCYRSLGRDAAGHSLRSIPKILENCSKVPDGHYDDCIAGALHVIVDFWGDGLQNQATGLCSAVPSESKPDCYAALRGRLEDTIADPARRREICGGFEAAYAVDCEGL
ncbi:MAG: hypothetical protein Greene041619_1144 [Candidatus Peregrinibacteria bacterium Greene0416_19]|nr:MAG: hypothetical protein Greene041619_1144 [Candidatus Peregrinibacteria bacterium Greene0416_19]